jgi:hypothetical protein
MGRDLMNFGENVGYELCMATETIPFSGLEFN